MHLIRRLARTRKSASSAADLLNGAPCACSVWVPGFEIPLVALQHTAQYAEAEDRRYAKDETRLDDAATLLPTEKIQQKGQIFKQ